MRIIVLVIVLMVLIYLSFIPSSPSKEDLQNKNIVITGCSSGIGKELAIQYSSYGSNLILTARRLDLLEETRKLCIERGAKSVKIIQADVSNKDDSDRFIRFINDNFKSGVDILLLNHAVAIEGLLISKNDEIAEKEIRNVLDINFFSFTKLTKNLLKSMNKGSSIVAVSSQTGIRAMPFLSEYSSSKHAMHGYFNALRHELSLINKDIYVTVLPLGPILTEKQYEDFAGAMSIEECAKQMIAAIHGKVREVSIPRWTGFVSAVGSLIPEVMDEIVNTYFVQKIERYKNWIQKNTPPGQKAPITSYLIEDFKEIVGNVGETVSVQSLLVASVHYVCLFLLLVFLYLVVPGKVIDGYVCDSHSKPLKYKLNGLRISILVASSLFALHSYDIFDVTYFAVNVWPFCISGFVIGMIFCIYFYVKGKNIPHNKLEKTKRTYVVSDFTNKKLTTNMGVNDPTLNSFWDNFFAGFEFNPRFTLLGSVFDYKMFGYLFGAVVLEIILLSNLLLYYKLHNYYPLRLLFYTLIFFFWLNEYLFFEHVHLYTFDFIVERVGFKLTFGCLVFYPFFYPLGTFFVSKAAFQQGDFSLQQCAICALTFFVGWALSRGSNLQKFFFKISPQQKFLGFIEQKTVGGNLLCSFFWSLSRHINYLGEIVMAVGLCLFSRTFAWLYVIYYVGLLFTREREDNELCRTKYGEKWIKYCEQVPYRIIPYIY